MGKYLTKREFECKDNLFRVLGVEKEDAVGKNFAQLFQLIGKQYRTLSLKCHPDKGGSNEKMIALINAKNNITDYIKLLDLNYHLTTIQIGISSPQEDVQIVEEMERGEEVECSKHYNIVTIFAVLLIYASLIYLTVKFFQNIQLDLKNILFGIGLAGFVTTIIAGSLLQFHLKKAIDELQKEAQERSKALTVDDSSLDLEKELQRNKKYSILCTISRYLMPLSIVTMAASLVIESALNDFKTVDTKLLIGVSLLILSFGLIYLANEIQERKVANLVKEERTEGKLDDINVKNTRMATEYNV
ncbi:MAG: hypothetical protein sL5_04870 [Candidatus Mesenet longicola]|uniref:J domain-containing protein n=1 Tax=Candidatus Mesenet longicola TaxID=1892558 RepID=A0A8J3MM18_9RICK|nr:MAG: hypothetical protein sGL2_05200 [Candidatus Mesenet longicola]GHM59494.1 MAG: hypothetical protein sL5_04870 [Candidatus Mesenet longicola]